MIIRRVFIANRGEIAVRVIRTCRRLGVETVLAVSEADVDSTPARLADRTTLIGPAQPARSYLNVEAVVAAAAAAKADALHPGYGFLSENAKLARKCEEAGIVFIGPTPEQLDSIGDKLQARGHAIAAGLPVVPGRSVETAEDAEALAKEIGFPLLIKAVGGGGGRGMKLVREKRDIADAVTLAIAEAEAAFSDPRIYVERYVEHGRHVEVQILGDGKDVVQFGDRDCSIQRRYQKLVEEAPAPGLSPRLREGLRAAATAFGRHLAYRGAGTVEFLVDCERETFYFLEMNARIQVEHPVTEEVTGFDLIAEQIAIASGEPLRMRQEEVTLSGHAIECRINAEDIARDFRPSPGRVTLARFPAGEGIRVDTHMQVGASVPPFYDSLIAKVIAYGRTRDEAMERLSAALELCQIDGVATNVALHRAILENAAFRKGGITTAFLPAFLETFEPAEERVLENAHG